MEVIPCFQIVQRMDGAPSSEIGEYPIAKVKFRTKV